MRFLAMLLSVWMLFACGGGGGATPTYSVGGSISGLGDAQGLTLTNGSETLPVAGNTTNFTFVTQLQRNASYNVTVGTQPTDFICTVSHGTGTISDSHVTTVVVACVYQATVITLAGEDLSRFANGTGTATRFSGPSGVATDGAGIVYVADSGNNAVRKITPAGVVTTLAGSGTQGFANGTGSAASFSNLQGVAVDGDGNVYVADAGNHAIRKITPAGVVTTLAGNGTAGYADGTGPAASFNYPAGIAVDSVGNVYVADNFNNAIRKISPTGVVTTLAGGNGGSGFSDGISATASFSGPSGVAVDSAGDVYVADTNNHAIRKITPTGVVNTLAGTGTPGASNGSGSAASFSLPWGVAVDTTGNVYVAEFGTSFIRKITRDGVVATLAGGGTWGIDGTSRGYVNGPSATARFHRPTGVAVDSIGNVFVADTVNNAIRRIDVVDQVTTLAGHPSRGLVDGTGIGAHFETPGGVAVDGAGNVYVADSNNHAIRKINRVGVVTTLAGNGAAGFADGTGSAASFKYPVYLAVDGIGNVYVADSGNNAVRKITPAGVVTTLAGNGSQGFANGTGSAASFSNLQGVAVDGDGNVYVADAGNHAIRKITPAGVVTTLTGNGTAGYADGTGPAASFNYPAGIAVDSVGDVYVVDQANYAIRKITLGGVVTTLAGSPQSHADGIGTDGSFSDADGTGAAAAFDWIQGLAVDKAGNVYVADTFQSKLVRHHVIRKITSGGGVTTLAGRDVPVYENGNGPLATAGFQDFGGIAVDSAGNLYVSDPSGGSIRKVKLAPDGG